MLVDVMLLSYCPPAGRDVHLSGQELQTLTSGGDLEGFMQTYAVLISESTGAMRGANLPVPTASRPHV